MNIPVSFYLKLFSISEIHPRERSTLRRLGRDYGRDTRFIVFSMLYEPDSDLSQL